MAVTTVWTAVLLTCVTGVLKGNVMGKPKSKDVLPLDMAKNSVDDMYSVCNDKMKDKALEEYLPNEKNTDSNFKQAWEEGEKIYQDKFKKLGPRVGKEQVIAIYIYTSVRGNFHRVLNDAVRSQGSEYKTTFKLHALHFFLTNAIQKLNANQNGECKTVYRRVNEYFDQNVQNKEFRFGSFTSTSMGRYPKAEVFGDKSCFEITTCFGADISMHSRYENEAEVLIPPYEVFKVTNIFKRSPDKKLECEVVYEVKSTEKPLSKLDCALF